MIFEPLASHREKCRAALFLSFYPPLFITHWLLLLENWFMKYVCINITWVVYEKFPGLPLGDCVCRFKASHSNQLFRYFHTLSQGDSEIGLKISHLKNSSLENWVYCFTYKLFSLCFIIKLDLFPEEIYRCEVNNMCSRPL